MRGPGPPCPARVPRRPTATPPLAALHGRRPRSGAPRPGRARRRSTSPTSRPDRARGRPDVPLPHDGCRRAVLANCRSTRCVRTSCTSAASPSSSRGHDSPRMRRPGARTVVSPRGGACRCGPQAARHRVPPSTTPQLPRHAPAFDSALGSVFRPTDDNGCARCAEPWVLTRFVSQGGAGRMIVGVGLHVYSSLRLIAGAART